MSKTWSEKLFEQYLADRSLGDFEFEKTFPGVGQKPDYSLMHRGKEILLEVKEFKQPRSLLTNRVMAIDPFRRIRGKMNDGRKKFRNLKGYPCGLVLHNLGNPYVTLDDPLIVWGAMLGNPGVETPVDIKRGKALPERSRPVFTKGGRMQPDRNTTISAILVLSHLGVGARGSMPNILTKSGPKPTDTSGSWNAWI